MNIFLAADHHLSHAKILTFLDAGGHPARPFKTIEEMDETIIDNHNRIVGPKDKVYYLGDLLINRRAFPIMHRFNGEKVLIRGNHDIFKIQDYLPFFKDVRGSHKLGDNILTHIPIHPDSVARWCGGNIHGHLHAGRVMLSHTTEINGKSFHKGKIDPRYFCVSLEHINYTPIAFDDVVTKLKDQQE